MFFTGLNQGIYNFYKNIFPLRKERMIQLELEKKTICSKQFDKVGFHWTIGNSQ